jgi:predicted RND superfamily exporter protein
MWDVAEDQTATNPLDIFSPTFQAMFSDSDIDGDWIPDTNIEALYVWLYTNNSTQRSATNYIHQADGGGFDGTVIRINVNTEGETKSVELYEELEEDVAPLTALVADKSIDQVSITGMSILIHVLLAELTDSMYQSVIITIVLCFIVLTIVFYYTNRSLVIGAITTVPVLLCMIWIMGSMYFLGIPFSVLTVSVSALTVGLGITYGIHITHRFLEDLQQFNDVEKASRNTIRHTGSALFGAAVTTMAGFGILVFSLLPPIQQFGGIIALTILYCFLASVFVLPTFLTIWAKRTMKKG